MSTSNKLENLEYLVMDLGTEIYQLKAELDHLKDKQQSYEKAIGDLNTILLAKSVLEDKEWTLSFPILEIQNLQESSQEDYNVLNINFAKKDFH